MISYLSTKSLLYHVLQRVEQPLLLTPRERVNERQEKQDQGEDWTFPEREVA